LHKIDYNYINLVRRKDKGKMIRNVSRVVEPQQVMEGAGVLLKRSIATRTLDYLDPFLLFDHFGSENPDDYMPGFPMHPHRGIETVTYMLAGMVNHRDSLGNAGSIQSGDVQWMTAGRGIMHEEMPAPFDGKMGGFQLWVNLPAASKMMRPRYQDIPSSRIPEVVRQNGTKIRVIAGSVDGVQGPVTEIIADPTYFDVTLPPGVEFTRDIPTGYSTFAYLFEGQGSFGSQDNPLEATHLVVFGDGDEMRGRASKDGMRFLLLAGKPLYEPIARYGPFVMNTRQEIEQALRDLRNGTFISAD
jgi:quercetin 2,3-dioxygenase